MANLARLAAAVSGAAEGFPQGAQMGLNLARVKAGTAKAAATATQRADADKLFQENRQKAEAQLSALEQQLQALLPAIEAGTDPNADAQFQALATRRDRLKTAYQKFILPYLKPSAAGAAPPLATLAPEAPDAGP